MTLTVPLSQHVFEARNALRHMGEAQKKRICSFFSKENQISCGIFQSVSLVMEKLPVAVEASWLRKAVSLILFEAKNATSRTACDRYYGNSRP